MKTLKTLPLLSLLAVLILAGCGQLSIPHQPNLPVNRFEMTSTEDVANLNLCVYRDKRTGREYLVTCYNSQHFVTLMPQEDK